jgi:hypothetical protein
LELKKQSNFFDPLSLIGTGPPTKCYWSTFSRCKLLGYTV